MGNCICNYYIKRACIYYDYRISRFLLIYCMIDSGFGYNYHIPIKLKDDCKIIYHEGCFGFYNLPKNFKIEDSQLGYINENELKKILIKNDFIKDNIEKIISDLKSYICFEN